MNDRELLDWNDPKPAIPAWCPLRSNARLTGPQREAHNSNEEHDHG